MSLREYNDNYDQDRDGKISVEEVDRTREIIDIEVKKDRASTQRRMAWMSMFAMLFFTLMLFTPIISDTRVQALSDLIGLFFIAQAGIVGAYMGVTAWITNSSSSYRRFDYQPYNQYSSQAHPKRDTEDGVS